MDSTSKDEGVPSCPPKLKKFLQKLSNEKRSPELTAGFGIAIQNDKGKPPIISLTGVAAQIPAPPAKGAWVLGAVNGVFTWFPVTACPS
jgi:hypothetical protein